MAFLRLVRNDFLLGKSEDVIEKLILYIYPCCDVKIMCISKDSE